jgi:hypothetical protein
MFNMIRHFIRFKVRGIQYTLQIWDFCDKFKYCHLISIIHVIFSKRYVFTEICFKLVVLHILNTRHVPENASLTMSNSVRRSFPY